MVLLFGDLFVLGTCTLRKGGVMIRWLGRLGRCVGTSCGACFPSTPFLCSTRSHWSSLFIGDVVPSSALARVPTCFLTETVRQVEATDRHNRRGGITRTRDKEHTRTVLQNAANFPKVVFTTNNQMIQQCIVPSVPMQRDYLITSLVASKSNDYSNEPSPISELSPTLQSSQGDRIGPGRWPVGAASAPMPTSVTATPCERTEFPTPAIMPAFVFLVVFILAAF